MPPKQAPKRKASSPSSSPSSSHPKKPKPASPDSDPLRTPHPLAPLAETHGIVQRAFYPPEMSTARARAYTTNTLPRPIEALQAALRETEPACAPAPGRAVVHWFRADLRQRDNRGLCAAGAAARAAGVPLIGLYIVSPQDWAAHAASAARVDFALRSVARLRGDLDALDIPLHVETVGARGDIPARVAGLARRWGAREVYANMEYEVDELRRDARVVRRCAGEGVRVRVLHDTCVVPPGELKTGAGGQYAVYTPWFRAWVARVNGDGEVLREAEGPGRNPGDARERLRDVWEGAGEVPEAPEGMRMDKDERERMRKMWPAGEAEAWRRLGKFCEERIGAYAEKRNFPAADGTSSLSVHLAAGTLSARAAVRAARECSGKKTDKVDVGPEGVKTWISEVAWRDFYRHVLVHWPYVCMNKPFKPEYANIEWSYDKSHLTAWQEGRTGFPIVDAAMRQAAGTGWMHNRCRMIVASFLAKDLLLDWRLGERWFMEHLIDGDFASNSGGWGFGASVGVDPQPYFRIFNPLLQSEKFDPDGEYIRKWVPELRDVEGKAIHDPYGRGKGALAKKMGYPEPIVSHKECRERALKAYKAALEQDKASSCGSLGRRR
ncbi:deoxyribodipyrimidine photo-lyase [Camillea tinctor]|nr:deoxyribodipyrimidine photo-lyase [Camillea tinctor]